MVTEDRLGGQPQTVEQRPAQVGHGAVGVEAAEHDRRLCAHHGQGDLGRRGGIVSEGGRGHPACLRHAYPPRNEFVDFGPGEPATGIRSTA